MTDFSNWSNMKQSKFIKKWIVPFIAFASLTVFFRVFILDIYKINSSSMEPTLMAGDIIIVGKLCYGARIIKIFKLLKQGKIDYYRLPGFSTIKRGDIFVFDYHNINYSGDDIPDNYRSIFVKRCFTTPGNFTVIKKYDDKKELNISNLPGLFPQFYQNIWSISDYGPLYVPARGDSIRLNNINIQIYKNTILNEEQDFQFNHGGDEADEKSIPFYKFKYDYYFALGDNFYNSIDSRHNGFVCEKDILGKVILILFSIDNHKKGFKKIRLNRVVHIFRESKGFCVNERQVH